MDRVFRAMVLDAYESAPGEAPVYTDSFFVVSDEDEEFLNQALGEKYGIDAGLFLMNASGAKGTWAVVFFTEELHDANPLLLARRGFDAAVKFTIYGDNPPEGVLPPLGVMAIYDADALRPLSARHPLYKRAYELLEGRSRQDVWVVLLDTRTLARDQD